MAEAAPLPPCSGQRGGDTAPSLSAPPAPQGDQCPFPVLQWSHGFPSPAVAGWERAGHSWETNTGDSPPNGAAHPRENLLLLPSWMEGQRLGMEGQRPGWRDSVQGGGTASRGSGPSSRDGGPSSMDIAVPYPRSPRSSQALTTPVVIPPLLPSRCPTPPEPQLPLCPPTPRDRPHTDLETSDGIPLILPRIPTGKGATDPLSHPGPLLLPVRSVPCPPPSPERQQKPVLIPCFIY